MGTRSKRQARFATKTSLSVRAGADFDGNEAEQIVMADSPRV